MSNKIVYEVEYKDDWNRQHISYVQTMKEVKYLQQRYDKVVFTATPLKQYMFFDRNENF